jgi:hypothetical protein
MMPNKKKLAPNSISNGRIPVLREVVTVNARVKYLTPEASSQIKHKLTEIDERFSNLRRSLEHYEYIAKGFRQASAGILPEQMNNAFQASGQILLTLAQTAIAEARELIDKLEDKINKNIKEGEFK